jgi:hypothetical protein
VQADIVWTYDFSYIYYTVWGDVLGVTHERREGTFPILWSARESAGPGKGCAGGHIPSVPCGVAAGRILEGDLEELTPVAAG